MDKFIVTKGDIPRIVPALLKDYSNDDLAAPLNLQVHWPFVLLSVAADLCTDMEKFRKIKTNLQLGKISKVDALTQILDQWVGESGQSKSSTLDKLFAVLSSNGLGSIAGKLKSIKPISMDKPVPTRRSQRNPNVKAKVANPSSSGKRENEESLSPVVLESSAQERALANCVILEEIFKHLSIKDRKSFRLVNKFWMNETFAYWRRTTWIQIDIYSIEELEFVYQEFLRAMTLPPYFEIFLEQLSNQPLIGHFGINKRNLQSHPFRRLSISSNVYLPLRQNEDMKLVNVVNALWKLLGPHVTHLKLNRVKLGNNFEVLEMLLLKTCPNLVELQVNGCDYENPYNFGFNAWRKKITYTENTVAKNLRTLLLSPFFRDSERYRNNDTSSNSNILKLCPGLKVFLSQKESNLEALLLPSLTGEVIKLESLTTKFPLTQDFASMRKYIEMFPSSLKHLDISIELSRARTSPFNLYVALAKCSSLQTLKLVVKNSLKMTGRAYLWFMDLSAIPFPNLTKLTYMFEGGRLANPFRYAVRFDFGTLRSMPKLEELQVLWDPSFSSSNEKLRKPNAEDYLYGGTDRDRYLPDGLLLPLVPNSSDSIMNVNDIPAHGQNLKKLSFNCWPLNSQDVKIFAFWFPNLTHLTVPLNGNACSAFIKSSWRKLDTLTLLPESSVTLNQLQMIKEGKEKLRLIQKAKQFPTFVVEKGQKGVVFEEFSTD